MATSAFSVMSDPDDGSTRQHRGILDVITSKSTSRIGSGLVIGATLAVSWLLAYSLGGASKYAPHWFYVPVILTGLRFGRRGAAVVAIAAAIVAGPLLPDDVAHHIAQTKGDWVSRGVFFFIIGMFVAALFDLLRRASVREARLTETRRIQEAREESMRESERRFRSLVQSSSDLIVVCTEGYLTYVTPTSQRVLGVDDADLVGTPVAELVHTDDRVVLLERIAGASHLEHDQLQCRARHADGSYRWVEMVMRDLTEDPGVRGCVVNIRDVDDRHRLEVELRHAQKLESVGRLAAGVAHELNTPIQFVSDNLHFVQQALDEILRLPPAYAAALATVETREQIDAAVDRLGSEFDVAFVADEVPAALRESIEGLGRLAKIVQAMKSFGDPGPEARCPADLNEAIATTLLVAQNEFGDVADLVTRYGDLPFVTCHVQDIHQAVLNLLVNAAHAVRDAVPGGGRGTITVSTRVAAGHAVIDVADTGPGVSDAIADRIFEPFFTTKEVGEGTGQGLSLARSLIVDRHGGTLTFDSAPATGTTFTIRIPLESSASQPSGL